MKEQLTKRLPYWLLTTVTLKSLYFGFDWPTVSFLVVLGGVVAFMETNASNAIINDFKTKVDSLEKRLDESEKEISEMKNYVSAAKLSNIRIR